MEFTDSELPKNWSELVSLKKFLNTLVVDTVRFEDDQNFYSLYRQYVSKEIRFKILFDSFGDHDRIILRNNFPYSRLTKNIPYVYHYCLWSKNGKINDVDVEKEIQKKFSGLEYFWFENCEEAKSIPEVWHCHIFVKEK
jgi:hypothetical protein